MMFIPPSWTKTQRFRLISYWKRLWLGKDALFRYGAGLFMGFLGGVPVDRSKSNHLVTQMVEEIGRRDSICLVVPPEGTRKRTEHWHSGFYWMAHGAHIPIVCGFLDYGKKEAGLGLSFVPTGDVPADMDRIRQFYQDIVAKYPQHKSPVRLREEA